MLSEYIKCADPTDKVACLVDNHYNGICAQTIDVDEDIDNEEEVILNSFLGVADSKVLSLIEALAQEDENQNYEQARNRDQNYKNRRFARQFRSTTLIRKLPTNPNPLWKRLRAKQKLLEKEGL